MVVVITCVAPVNIAVIKYWGKRDEQLILPINDSISITLDTDHMHAKTSVAASPDFEKDRIWLNGNEEDVGANQRLINCLVQVRKRAKGSKINPEWKVHINSNNNFPTAAGLASSAAGYACLVYALCNLYGVEGDISALARQGSGSACRSVYGGYVRWHMGMDPEGVDSIARIVEPKSHWPEMKCLIMVVNDGRKKVPSSKGMKMSWDTSEYLKYRASKIVPERTEEMAMAIKNRDFRTFAKLTMMDSNSLHAVCLDTFPPIAYMNQVSHGLVDLVHMINDICGNDNGNPIAAYTFDAGPNCCLFLLEHHLPIVLSIIKHFYPPDPEMEASSYIRGEASGKVDLSKDMIDKFNRKPQPPGCLKYIISTGVGSGPKTLSGDHLLDSETGLPVH